MDSNQKYCCFTGHRVIRREHREKLIETLPETVKKLASDGVTGFICGGAIGFDTIASQAVLKARGTNPEIKLILALPCKNQHQSWTKSDKDEYMRILSLADEVIYVSDEYFNGCMQKRNRYMVDHSDICVYYMSYPRGGTAYTVKYALENELSMYNAINGEIC